MLKLMKYNSFYYYNATSNNFFPYKTDELYKISEDALDSKLINIDNLDNKYYIKSISLKNKIFDKKKKVTYKTFVDIYTKLIDYTIKQNSTYSYNKEIEKSKNSFKLLSFNILHNELVRDKQLDIMEDWNIRKEKIINILLIYKPHIICLQEVDLEYSNYIKEVLNFYNYNGEYFYNINSNIKYGNLTLWNTKKFKYLEKFEQALTSCKIANVIKLEFNKKPLLISNMHLTVPRTLKNKYGIKQYNEIFQHEQVNNILRIIKSLNVNNYILAGDSNSLPENKNYKFLLSKKLFSSYRTILHKEPEITTYNVYDKFIGTLDYIFYNKNCDLQPYKVLNIPKFNKYIDFLPNLLYPSDHYPIMTKFILN